MLMIDLRVRMGSFRGCDLSLSLGLGLVGLLGISTPVAAQTAATPLATPTPLQPTTTPVTTITTTPPKPPAANTPPPLLSGNKDGIWELSPAGKRLRRLSRTPASFLRFIPGPEAALSQVVFVTKSQSELRLLDVPTQKERLLTKLPKSFAARLFYQRADHEPITLQLHSGEDFVADAKSACLMLMDRNVNMMDHKGRLDVNLATGKFTMTPLYCGQDQEQPTKQCKRAMEQQHPKDLGFCQQSYAVGDPTAGAGDAFPYRFEKGLLMQRQPDGSWKSKRKVKTFEEEGAAGRSPTGRFQLLSGFSEGGDYIYRHLIVFDAQQGVFLNLDNAALRPIPPAELARPVGRVVTGEAEVRWLADPDRLLIEDTLCDLSERTTTVVGTLAR